MMKQPFSQIVQRLNRFSVTVVLAGGLLLALPVLAVFQYHWLGRLSESELNRMQSNLRVSAQRFSDDFDRVFNSATEVFQTRSADGSPTERLAAAMGEWRATDHAKLVRSLGYATATPTDTLTLWHFDLGRSRLVRDHWTPAMKGIRERLASSFLPEPGTDRIVVRHLSSIDWFPWIVIPVLPDAASLSSTGPRVEHILLEIDTTYLSGTLIPGLLHRHFSGLEDYEVMVRQPVVGTILYTTSDADFQSGKTDIREPMGTIRLSDMVWVTTLQKDKRKITTEMTTIGRMGGLQMSKPGRGLAGVLGAQVEERKGTIWEIIIRHRAGSLEEAVASGRMRNILISSTVFILLGLSVVMLVRAAQNARRLAQLQLEFVAGITHELRTPLAVIRSAGENLADGVVKSPDQVQNYGRLVHREGKRLSDMVEQVLGFAGTQADKLILKREPMNLKDMIVESLEELEAGMSGTEFFITASLSDDIPEIHADRLAIRTVFRNVLDNALKYGRKDGSVEVLGTVHEEGGKEYCRIAIQDNGIGIPREDLPHIYEPFYRGRKARQLQIRGNGLGLSLVKKVVEAHGGYITVESTDGQGSIFTIYLPTEKPEGEGSEP